jgi:hypothetical protein
MKKFILVFSVTLLFPLISFSQISTPAKRPFNFGFFSGIGGVNFTPIPGIDLHYRGTVLRIAPGYRDNAVGIVQEIIPLSEVFYNWYWIGSLYAATGYEKDVYGVSVRTNHFKGILLTGAKVYFNTRLYSQLQGGMVYTKYSTSGYPSDEEITPYFEFSLGINLFKSYLNEMDFQ